MKRVLPLLLLVALSVACRKAPPPAPATASAPAAAPAPAEAFNPAEASTATAAPTAGATPVPAGIKPVPAELPAIVARVNGEAIERWEVESALRAAEALAGGPVPAGSRDRVLRGVLDQLVAFHVLVQESRARKLDVTDADVKGRIDAMRKDFPNNDAFLRALTSEGLTLERLQRQARMNLQVDKLVETEIAPTIAVPDSDVRSFYEKNAERFQQGETVHASHILVRVPQNASDSQKQQAGVKAQQLLSQVRGGADFARVAREASQDQGSAPNGGDLGFFAQGQMDPAFEAAAFALEPGSLSGVVETPFGFHIIKLHERRPPRTIPLAEVGTKIRQYLIDQLRNAKLAAFAEQAKAKFKVEILV